jgi:hypothetical protein
MLTKEELKRCAEYLSGSCTMGDSYIEAALDRPGTDEEEAQLLAYLEEIDLHECNNCGWFGYPGDTTDANGYCDECVADLEEDDSDEF